MEYQKAVRTASGAEQVQHHGREEAKCIEVEYQKAVRIGDLERHKEVLKVVTAHFNKAMFPNAYVREEVGEVALRAGEAGMLRAFIDTTTVADHRSD